MSRSVTSTLEPKKKTTRFGEIWNMWHLNDTLVQYSSLCVFVEHVSSSKLHSAHYSFKGNY